MKTNISLRPLTGSGRANVHSSRSVCSRKPRYLSSRQRTSLVGQQTRGGLRGSQSRMSTFYRFTTPSLGLPFNGFHPPKCRCKYLICHLMPFSAAYRDEISSPKNCRFLSSPRGILLKPACCLHQWPVFPMFLHKFHFPLNALSHPAFLVLHNFPLKIARHFKVCMFFQQPSFAKSHGLIGTRKRVCVPHKN